MRGLTDSERAMLAHARGDAPCAEHAHAGPRRRLSAAVAASLLRRGLLLGEDCRVFDRTIHVWPTSLAPVAMALDAAAREGVSP